MGEMADLALEQFFEEEHQHDLEYEDRMYVQRITRSQVRGGLSYEEECDAMKDMLMNGF